MFFGHFSAYFSLLNHYISSLGTSENHRKTCGKVSWRYGYDPVHITYPSTRNTSENRRSFFPQISHCFSNCLEKSFAWNGFSGLIREISRIRSENQFQANLICPKWGRKTHFGPIHPHRGWNAGVWFYEFYEFPRFVFSSTHQKYERYGDIVAPVEILVQFCIFWDSGTLKI